MATNDQPMATSRCTRSAHASKETTTILIDPLIDPLMTNATADPLISPTSQLPAALERFAAFFTCPLLREDSTSREMRAVDSEYRRNLQVHACTVTARGVHAAGRCDGF